MAKLKHPIPGLTEVVAELESGSARSCGIVAASLLDHFLQLAILSRFRPLNSELRDSIFDFKGAIGGTANKIDVAYALNLFPTEHRHDMIVVNRVRNRFAHDLAIRDFEHREIAQLVDSFQLDEGLRTAKDSGVRNRRESYIDVATYLVAGLADAAAEEQRPALPSIFSS